MCGMTFRWTEHRFAGGALALDVANSVILRSDAARSVDRFAVAGQIATFAEAATRLGAERERFPPLVAPDEERRPVLFDLREAIDDYFRSSIADGGEDNGKLAQFLFACGAALRMFPKAEHLANATAHSALSLLADEPRQRLRICGNCGWLFIDRSKNRSRIWCDMAVCGNRQKASRHYHRRKETRS
ncbi:UNVERIFIED_ORG: putative RNA-binding Zn ribbon-like protein [Rhizobium sp. SORGH_AS260]|jgi:predicted RNA-binding Zn ribbon-like protein|uniref:CGNR zinc finger domain-containing protein n=1 Tax=Agrobacterium sp. SORGH_AS_0440 TaxID=3041757 RepID=UPI00278516F5|nr:CGNR zinc finger domain-containing protein [Agrobacterium sp. SORGH_AS_0440]MDP9732866.1 putative RNA-binding Zn ribbon-like protein [Rhizobium sp. SORGH_AS_0285]MDP9755304.1 putative RNA-binding Zn ribbon-like protein [Rhizobium sp. SORGH_AS_0260]MDR6082038.1 putative RNA-binding Zn ribbon-like protein [Agrobacterium sp. SORGH_AS_0440]